MLLSFFFLVFVFVLFPLFVLFHILDFRDNMKLEKRITEIEQEVAKDIDIKYVKNPEENKRRIQEIKSFTVDIFWFIDNWKNIKSVYDDFLLEDYDFNRKSVFKKYMNRFIKSFNEVLKTVCKIENISPPHIRLDMSPEDACMLVDNTMDVIELDNKDIDDIVYSEFCSIKFRFGIYRDNLMAYINTLDKKEETVSENTSKRSLNREDFVVSDEDYKRTSEVDINYHKEFKNYLFVLYGNRCVKCSNMKNLEVDHLYIPKVKGGNFIMIYRDGYKINNAVPLCRKCNAIKYDKSYKEFFNKKTLAIISHKNTIMNDFINGKISEEEFLKLY